MSFMDLETPYDRVNREDAENVGCGLNGIKKTHVNTVFCEMVKGGESECLRMGGGGVKQGCIMLLGFSICAVMK